MPQGLRRIRPLQANPSDALWNQSTTLTEPSDTLVNHTNTLLCEDDMSQDGRWQVRVMQCVGASENNSKEFYRPLVIPVSYETPDVEQKQMALLCAEIQQRARKHKTVQRMTCCGTPRKTEGVRRHWGKPRVSVATTVTQWKTRSERNVTAKKKTQLGLKSRDRVNENAKASAAGKPFWCWVQLWEPGPLYHCGRHWPQPQLKT